MFIWTFRDVISVVVLAVILLGIIIGSIADLINKFLKRKKK